MKKFKRLCVVSPFIITALVVVYAVMNGVPSESLLLETRALQIIQAGGCESCHTAEPVLPFYAKMPVAGDVVMQDVEQGYRAYDIAPLMKSLSEGEMPSPVDVAKIEKVALDKRMPAAKYYLVHWGSQMTNAKRDIILDAVAAYRNAYYADGLVGERAAEPVRPIGKMGGLDESKVKLGYDLYHDLRLSIDNTVSCASCHDLSTGGVDNHQYSHGVNDQLGGVNAPTVYNAVYNFVQFWDGRARTLAEQAAGPPLNPVEMGYNSFDEIMAKLSEDKALVSRFEAIYNDGVTEANITDAIEEFEYTLTTPNSQFDKWLRGDDAAITAEELYGYELFKENNCAMCHMGANLGGESYELMGLYRPYFKQRGAELTEEDNGRYKQTKLERDRHRFKVPGLRNVELTWPYYHDGTRHTLDEAVADMARYQADEDLDADQVQAIVAFLRTLTGEYEGEKLTTSNTYGVVIAPDDDEHHHDH
ncbi:MAG: heme-binding domain-containing protein [Alistipes sp.]|nr:heme-binding domain-containing protein [Alistipes sp.]